MIEVRIDTYHSKIDLDSEWEKVHVVVHTSDCDDVLKYYPRHMGFKLFQQAEDYANMICNWLLYLGKKEIFGVDSKHSKALVRYIPK